MRFLVELYLPQGATEPALEQAVRLRDTVTVMRAQRRAVAYLRTLVLPQDESCLHVVDAPDRPTAAEMADIAGLHGGRVQMAVELVLDANGPDPGHQGGASCGLRARGPDSPPRRRSPPPTTRSGETGGSSDGTKTNSRT